MTGIAAIVPASPGEVVYRISVDEEHGDFLIDEHRVIAWHVWTSPGDFGPSAIIARPIGPYGYVDKTSSYPGCAVFTRAPDGKYRDVEEGDPTYDTLDEAGRAILRQQLARKRAS
jgi:hypothetical protein